MATYYIYKICCEDASIADFYVGSSKNIRDRKSKHKGVCNNETWRGHNYKIYQTIRANGGWNNWRMVVIEEMSNTTLIGARIREEFHRVELKATLNTYSAYTGLTKEEYIKKYDETHKEEKKEYRATRSEEIKEYNKEYKATHKEEIKKQQDKYRIEYRATHREEINRKQIEHRATHREEINRKSRETYAMKKAEKSTQSLESLV